MNKNWIIGERIFQFKYRNCRLLADWLCVQGLPFNDIVETASKILDLPIDLVRSEVSKYYPWTGLGATYTLGYRKFLRLGINDVTDIFLKCPATTWEEFMHKKHE